MSDSGLIKKCVQHVIVAIGKLIGFYYGLIVLYGLLRRWIKNTSDHFWERKVRELPPACLNDPAVGNHVYIQIKNVKLHYVEKGDRSKPLMLCIHGFPEFWYSWRHQLQEFSKDYWVVAVDMRGYGDSEKPVGKESYKVTHLVADVKNLVHALGKDKVTLVAHDWGGIVAWYFVLLESQLVEAYVIMNSVHPVAFRNTLVKSLSQLKKSWYVFFYQMPFLPEFLCQIDDVGMLEKILRTDKSHPHITDDDIEAFKFTFGKKGAFTPPINYYRSNFLQGGGSRVQDLGKNPDLPPGLILFGEKDNFITKQVQEQTVQLVSNSRLVCIPDANHFVQQDKPAAVNKAMRDFLRSVR